MDIYFNLFKKSFLIIIITLINFRVNTMNSVSPIPFSQYYEIHPLSQSSVRSLVETYREFLKNARPSIVNSEVINIFQLEQFKTLLKDYTKLFQKNCCYRTNFGFIEKYALESFEHPKIFVRADLHGDLKSLVENLQVLQREGLLGENYDCNPGVHLVFLGDYCDRGFYGTEILGLLMHLHLENPDQVHLIRGNHEDLSINLSYGFTDQNLQKVLGDLEAKQLLNAFYETMPLSLYFCVNGEDKEYVQFTHGLFEVSFDPSPLLDHPSPEGSLLIPKTRALSQRVKDLSQNPNHPLNVSAKQITKIFSETLFTEIEKELTLYNWADVSSNQSYYSNLASRQYKLNAHDIKHYLNLSSDHHQVKLIFRGHQHVFSELLHEQQLITTTLTVGVDSSYQLNTFDKAYILTLQPKVADWDKKSIVRIRESDESVIHQENSILKSDHPVREAGKKPAFYLNQIS